MKLRILESARKDLREGHTFYERRQQGVGNYFLDTLFSEIESLRLYGGMHAVRLGFHRMLSAKFPYAVYYRVHGGEVTVHAVLDCRRDPASIEWRLR